MIHSHSQSKFRQTMSAAEVQMNAEDVIDNVSHDLDAELVVLGTIGRTGLSAAFIGNTAEHVIDRLNCDVLAIKPDGYRSPLDVN